MTIKKMKNYREQRGFALIAVMIAILVIAVIAFGAMNWKGQIEQNKEIKNQAEIDLQKINDNLKKNNQAIVENLADTLSTIDTADWQKYKDLGFEISYPGAWIIDKSLELEGIVWFRTKSRQADLDAGKSTKGFDVGVKVYNTVAELPNNQQEKLSFTNWISKQEAESPCPAGWTPIKSNGINWYEGSGNCEIAGGSYSRIAEKNGKIYEIEIEGEGKLTDEQMSIMESFKFTQ